MASIQLPSNSTHFASSEAFGPTNNRTFDFTLVFEQSIMSIGSSAVLLLAVPLRWFYLRSQSEKTRRNDIWSSVKLLTIGLFGTLQLAQLVLWAKVRNRKPLASQISIAANALGLCDCLALAFLSFVEQRKSIRPSTVIAVYLFFSIAFDAVQCRTLWLLAEDSRFRQLAALLSSTIAVKLSILFLEAKGKRNLLMHNWSTAPPEALSGILGRGIFWWLNDLLLRGFKSSLSIETLWPTDDSMSSIKLLQSMNKPWAKEKSKVTKNALLLALLRSLKWSFLAPVFTRICLIGLRFSQPLLINRIIKFIGQPASESEKNVGYGLIGATVLIYLGLAVMNGLSSHKTFRFLTMVRGTLVSMILSTTLNLPASIEGSATLTLMSTDIERVCSGLEGLHEMWASPIEVGIAIWLLQREMGVACVVPSVIALASTAAVFKLASFIGPASVAWNKAVQERVSFTSSILGSMKEVKLLGMTDVCCEKILELRVKELNRAKQSRTLGSIRVTLVQVSSYLTPAITFGAFIAISKYWTGETLSIQRTFTSLALIVLLTEPLAQMFASIPRFAITRSCLERIQKFIQSVPDLDFIEGTDESNSNTGSGSEIELQTVPSRRGIPTDISREVLKLENASFGKTSSGEPILQDLNFTIDRSSITVIIGKVGSGKSTLLKSLIGEIPCTTGNLQGYLGSTAYCDQQPWLINGTIQHNILGDSTLEARWYDTVTKACALDVDFQTLPAGDRSLIGSKGISLSGGQKQRVALARALYSRLPFFVCDDVLSGLDPRTQDLIWDRVFGVHGLLRLHGITAVIATHTVHRLREADKIIVLGDDGTIVEQGSFESLSQTKVVIQELLAKQTRESGLSSDSENSETSSKAKDAHVVTKQEDANNDLLRRTGDFQVYKYYLKSVGWRHGIILFWLSVVGEFCLFFPQIWVKWWAEADVRHPGADTGLYYSVYLSLGVIGLIFVGLSVRYNFVVTGPDSGVYLHLKLLNTIMRAPLAYFVTTDTGVTVNRFSQDISLVDMVLPGNAWLTMLGLMKCIGIAILIFLGIKYMAIVVPFSLLILYTLQLFYLRTSRQLRHMDLEAKSPLYTHLLEMIQGLSTIRSYKWSSSFLNTGLDLLDISQRPFYLLYCIQRWLTFTLDIFVAILAIMFVGIAVSLKGHTTAGAVGLALLNILSLNTALATTIEMWTELETSLGAIARLKDVETTTESEEVAESGSVMPEPEWPQEGRVVFENVNVSYTENSNMVLEDINLNIQHGEKIAVCGRTGSGKSSLLLTLTHLLHPQSGTVYISGRNGNMIPRSYLRSKLNTIPQESFFLLGHITVRENLSLFCSTNLSESALKSALETVHLSQLIPQLSSPMTSVSLSQGEKQLFCLARAIIRKEASPFLILDEANAALDNEKDMLMREIVRTDFADKTVVSVVHKVQDIVGFYDKVLVLDQGRIVEFDRPEVLLQREGSVFKGLVREKV